jgi:hypothetical protein
MVSSEDVVKPATKRRCAIVELLSNEIVLGLSEPILGRGVSQCLGVLVKLSRYQPFKHCPACEKDKPESQEDRLEPVA